MEIIRSGSEIPPTGSAFELSHGRIGIARRGLEKQGRAHIKDPFEEREGHAFFDVKDELRLSRPRSFEDGRHDFEIAFLEQLVR